MTQCKPRQHNPVTPHTVSASAARLTPRGTNTETFHKAQEVAPAPHAARTLALCLFGAAGPEMLWGKPGWEEFWSRSQDCGLQLSAGGRTTL